MPALPRGSHDGAADHNCRTYIDLADLLEVRKSVTIYYLQRLKKGSVVDHQETEVLGVTIVPHPAAYGDLLADIDVLFPVKFSDVLIP